MNRFENRQNAGQLMYLRLLKTGFEGTSSPSIDSLTMQVHDLALANDL